MPQGAWLQRVVVILLRFSLVCVAYAHRALLNTHTHMLLHNVPPKVANVLGDVRRTLELCRRACQLALAEGAKEVTSAHAAAAYSHMFSSVHVAQLRAASPVAKCLLAAVLLECRATGGEQATFPAVYARLRGLINACGLDAVRVVIAWDAHTRCRHVKTKHEQHHTTPY